MRDETKQVRRDCRNYTWRTDWRPLQKGRLFAVGRCLAQTFHGSSPDAILFDDDYLVAGGIVALLECGLRIPTDVKLVTYSNSGNEPVSGVTLARVEADPVSYGDTLAAYVLKLLAGRRVSPPCLSWHFIPGESL